MNSLRQQCRVAFVLYVVGDVREESALGLQLFNILERALEPQMRFMRADSETVKHQNVQTAQPVNCRGRDLAQVCRVSKVIETIGNDGQASMDHLKRRDL